MYISLEIRFTVWGIWVVQPVKYPTIDFGLGHDIKPHIGLSAGHGPYLEKLRKLKKKIGSSYYN